MKFSIDTADQSEVVAAIRMLLALVDAEQAAALLPVKPRARQARAKTSNPHEVTNVAPADASSDAWAGDPPAEMTPIIVNGHAPAIPSADNGHTDLQDDPEAMRDRLRDVARQNGVLWLRPILAEHGVRRLGDLSDDQVQNLLREVVVR